MNKKIIYLCLFCVASLSSIKISSDYRLELLKETNSSYESFYKEHTQKEVLTEAEFETLLNRQDEFHKKGNERAITPRLIALGLITNIVILLLAGFLGFFTNYQTKILLIFICITTVGGVIFLPIGTALFMIFVLLLLAFKHVRKNRANQKEKSVKD